MSHKVLDMDKHISIHALREEGDGLACRCPGQRETFLSTPSARRATCKGIKPSDKRVNFYPRPPRGGRHGAGVHLALLGVISIHALREEGDVRTRSRRLHQMYFYPRPPRGGRRRSQTIGTHTAHFYPRPPRGGRLPVDLNMTVYLTISIHALREEGDRSTRRA